METMDTSYQRELPKQLLMYFTYNNNNLGDARKAFIYAGVTANKEREPQTFESYRENMETFAAQKLREGRINENYAVLYQEFLSEPKTREEGKLLAARMFTNRLYCDDKKIRSVIVRHSQLGRRKYILLVRAWRIREFIQRTQLFFSRTRSSAVTVPR